MTCFLKSVAVAFKDVSMSPVEATAAAASPFHSPRSLGLGNIGGCVMAFLWMTTMACLTLQFYSGWWFQPLCFFQIYVLLKLPEDFRTLLVGG